MLKSGLPTTDNNVQNGYVRLLIAMENKISNHLYGACWILLDQLPLFQLNKIQRHHPPKPPSPFSPKVTFSVASVVPTYRFLPHATECRKSLTFNRLLVSLFAPPLSLTKTEKSPLGEFPAFRDLRRLFRSPSIIQHSNQEAGTNVR